MKEILLTQTLTPLHWTLAFAGALLYLLMRIRKAQSKPGYTFGGYFKVNILTIIATVIMIPVCLLVISGSSLGDMLPINEVTALLIGYQTNSMFENLIGLGAKKYIAPTE